MIFYPFVFEVFPAFFLSDLGIGWIGGLVLGGMGLLVAQVSVVVVD